MWAIKNETSYAAERTWVRDKNGAHRWSVVVKATFDLGTDGAVRLADAQVPPLLVPEHSGEPARRTSGLKPPLRSGPAS